MNAALPKTFSLTENLFSGKTYLYTIASRVYRHVGDIGMVWTLDEFRSVEDKKLIGGHVFMMMGDYDSAQNMYLQSGTPVEALHMRRDLLHWDQVRISDSANWARYSLQSDTLSSVISGNGRLGNQAVRFSE